MPERREGLRTPDEIAGEARKLCGRAEEIWSLRRAGAISTGYADGRLDIIAALMAMLEAEMCDAVERAELEAIRARLFADP